jgi:hypothetical protein
MASDDDLGSGPGSASSASGSGDSDPEELGLDPAPPEFYDPAADDADAAFAARLRRDGGRSDAVLSCPACFTTLCVDCRAHARYETQFAAMFVLNCAVDAAQLVRPAAGGAHAPPRGKRRAPAAEAAAAPEAASAAAPPAAAAAAAEERYNPVACGACGEEVGLREVGPSGLYHFFHVLASNA